MEESEFDDFDFEDIILLLLLALPFYLFSRLRRKSRDLSVVPDSFPSTEGRRDQKLLRNRRSVPHTDFRFTKHPLPRAPIQWSW